MGRRSSFDYTQLGIGDCGHVVHTWPQITNFAGHQARVICDDCTRELHGLDESDEFAVWVRLKPPKKPKKTPEPAKPRILSPMEALLAEEGLYDGP